MMRHSSTPAATVCPLFVLMTSLVFVIKSASSEAQPFFYQRKQDHFVMLSGLPLWIDSICLGNFVDLLQSGKREQKSFEKGGVKPFDLVPTRE